MRGIARFGIMLQPQLHQIRLGIGDRAIERAALLDHDLLCQLRDAAALRRVGQPDRELAQQRFAIGDLNGAAGAR